MTFDNYLNVGFCHDTEIGHYVLNFDLSVRLRLNHSLWLRLQLVHGVFRVTNNACTSHVLHSTGDDVQNQNEFHEGQRCLFPSGNLEFCHYCLARSRLCTKVRRGSKKCVFAATRPGRQLDLVDRVVQRLSVPDFFGSCDNGSWWQTNLMDVCPVLGLKSNVVPQYRYIKCRHFGRLTKLLKRIVQGSCKQQFVYVRSQGNSCHDFLFSYSFLALQAAFRSFYLPSSLQEGCLWLNTALYSQISTNGTVQAHVNTVPTYSTDWPNQNS